MKIIISESQLKEIINNYEDEIDNENNQIRNRAIKELNSLVKVTKPGKYKLYRGSSDGNENSGRGIYANGIHYSNDPSTSFDFGESYVFNVTIKNPLIIKSFDIRKYGRNPQEITEMLLDMGYDTLVIVHEKRITVRGVDDYEESIPYEEHEVIKLNDNIPNT
jgi:hypothetical protein